MNDIIPMLEANWPIVAIAVVAVLLLAVWLIAANRKTRVEIEDKPAEPAPAKRNQALIDSAPSATVEPPSVGTVEPVVAPEPVAEPEPVATPEPIVTPEPVAAPEPAPAAEAGDDLTQIKGLGPKLAALLTEMGVTSIAQIAAWDDAEIDRIDAQLGRFQGRIRRDSWVEQAQLLSSGDRAAYEGQFGKT